MPEEPVIIVVVAGPRTGSTALGYGLESALKGTWFGEIFDSRRADPEATFGPLQTQLQQANFLHHRVLEFRQNPRLSLPSEDNQRSLFSSYKKRLVQSSGPSIVDVKYASWHHLDTYWRNPDDPPFLLTLLREAGAHFIHLERRNVFLQYLSLLRAQTSGRWHRFEGGLVDCTVVTIDLDHCDRSLRSMVAIRAQFRDWLGDSGDVHGLAYEDSFNGAELAPESVSSIAQALDIAPQPARCEVVPGGLPPRKLLRNRDEVLKHFESSEFAPFVADALE